MATITVQTVTASGLDVDVNDVAAAAGGDDFANDGKTFFLVWNQSVGALTVSFASPGVCEHGGTHPISSVSVSASGIHVFGPFAPPRFNDANGRVAVTYPGGVTSLTVLPFKHGG